MADTSDDREEPDPIERQIDKFVWSEARKAARAYEKAITRLWIGNAGGVLTALSFFGEKSQAKSAWPLLIPFGFFMSGLILMAIATLRDLYARRRMIRSAEGKSSWLRLPTNIFASPSETVGLGTVAMISTICFLCGCLTGFLALLSSVVQV